MILSNVEILKAIKAGAIKVGELTGNEDPTEDPFNTTSIDLHLADRILVPRADGPVAFDLTKPGISGFLERNSEEKVLTTDMPFVLKPRTFILADTQEFISLRLVPNKKGGPVYGARVEGRSSIARCGVLIHFTAPTVHPGFNNYLKLEIINLGVLDFIMRPGMSICQLIFESVKGLPSRTENQFSVPIGPTRKKN
jgi:dCTP deaminase